MTTLRAKHRSPRDLYWAVAIAVVVTWLMALNYGPAKSFSPWEFVFRCFPGGRGMRVIARYQLFLTFPLVIFAMRWFDTLKRRSVITALVIWLVVEQWDLAPPTTIDRPAEIASLAGVPPIPSTCDSFYIVSARATPYPTEHDDLIYAPNVDAMLIAALQAKPTVMGFSTFNPPGWNFVDPAAADFHERARTYIRNQGLTNACYLDRLHSPEWQVATP